MIEKMCPGRNAGIGLTNFCTLFECRRVELILDEHIKTQEKIHIIYIMLQSKTLQMLKRTKLTRRFEKLDFQETIFQQYFSLMTNENGSNIQPRPI